jgi:oxygen-independent coproporphyrinogen-3 oxidase
MSSVGEGIYLPWNEPTRVNLPRHLYVHIPLCASKCSYCDFYSLVDDGSLSHAEIVRTTVASLRGWLEPAVARSPLDTLYVGGGTPTVLGDELPGLLRALTEVMPLAEGAEVTIEANPDSLTDTLLAGLRDAGATRVSVGVQSLDGGALQLLGRRHDRESAIRALRSVTAAGLDLAADLMCGIPGVSPTAWTESLDAVVACGATHVSVYPLAVEEGTPLAADIKAGRIPGPDEDETVDALLAAESRLGAHDFVRYEIANYALPGHESRHNSAYWTGKPYLGIGGGAHGMLSGDQARALGLAPPEGIQVARLRYSYTCAPFPVHAESPLASMESLHADEAAREDAMLGMRMAVGITDELAEAAGAVDALESLVADGLVVHAEGRWHATSRGWLLGNEIFGRIWTAGEDRAE